MKSTYRVSMLPGLLAIVVGASACEPGEQVESTEPEEPQAEAGSQAVTGTASVFTDGGGATTAVHAPEGGALFTVASSRGQTVKSALLSWLRTGVYYGLGSAATIDLVQVRSVQDGNLKVVHFSQTYRGIPLIGHAAQVVVTLHGDVALSVTGRPIDAAPDYAGVLGTMSAEDAEAPVVAAYLAEQEGSSAPVIEAIELVAVPTFSTLAWRAQVREAGHEGMEILVHAVTGGVISRQVTDSYDLTQKKPVHLLVEPFSADPVTLSTGMAWDMPGAIAGYCADPVSGAGCLVRMGSMRLSVYDYQDDNTATPLVQTMPIWDLFDPQVPWSKFLYGPPSFGFNAQNLYHKAATATTWVDPFVTVLGWDHHPNVPWSSAEPSSLLMMVDVDGQDPAGPSCKQALGLYAPYAFSANDAAIVDPPYGTATLPRMSICKNDESTVFHELGHYYDDHLATGTMGHGIAIHNTCVADTSDEAPPLAETVADMLTAALYAQLYPSMAYDMSTTPLPCSLGVMSLPGQVHGAPCGGPRHFSSDRPTAVANGACDVQAGYDQIGVQQAWWKFLKGQTCMTQTPWTCTAVPQDPETGLRALLYALSVGNGQSYKQLFRYMKSWIQINGTADEKTRFTQIFTQHGLL